MIEDNKRNIKDVLNLLTRRDLDWVNPKMLPKFKTLYDGWRQKELRAKIHSAFFYSNAWKRGWLQKADFVRFRDYAME